MANSIPSQEGSCKPSLAQLVLKTQSSHLDYFSNDPVLESPLIRSLLFVVIVSNLCCMHSISYDNQMAVPRCNVGFDRLHKVHPIFNTMKQSFHDHNQRTISKAALQWFTTCLQSLLIEDTRYGVYMYVIWKWTHVGLQCIHWRRAVMDRRLRSSCSENSCKATHRQTLNPLFWQLLLISTAPKGTQIFCVVTCMYNQHKLKRISYWTVSSFKRQ